MPAQNALRSICKKGDTSSEKKTNSNTATLPFPNFHSAGLDFVECSKSKCNAGQVKGESIVKF
jgi:hypothetical protein